MSVLEHDECHEMSFPHTLQKHTLNEKGDEMRESEGNEMIDGLRDVCERIQTHTYHHD